MNGKSYSQEENDFLVKNYPTNGIEYCAVHLKRPINALKARVIRMKLKLNKEVKSKIYSEAVNARDRSYKVSKNHFIDVKSPEAAYILGLLWADGYIFEKKRQAEIRLSIVKKDYEVFAPTFFKTGQWTTGIKNASLRGGINRQEQGFLNTSNRPLVQYLISLDYDKKSFVSADKVLTTIPDDLKHYWFRGLFDGDGTLYINPDGKHTKLSICSTYSQDWSYLCNLFESWGNCKYQIHRRIQGPKSKHSVFQLTGRQSILKFCEYIYNGWEKDGIGLKRKHDKYLLVLEIDKVLKLYCGDREAYYKVKHAQYL